MLTERWSVEDLAKLFCLRDEWTPFPRARDRAAWEGLLRDELNRRRRDFLVGKAGELAGQPWPALPASLYMEFNRSGDRRCYERHFFERRRRIAVLALTECFAHEGAFLDDLIDGLWIISEEATWSSPAHASKNTGDSLPKQDEESLALFSCETAFALAEISYLLADELDAVSPTVRDRLHREIERRILQPFENDPEERFGWMGGGNNWCPWCCSSILGAAMYVMDDPQRLARIAHRLMQGVDRFISKYPSDGGCDEGPMYWGKASGAMLLFLELLYSRSNGAVSIYDEPLIRKMGLYRARTQLDGEWVASFSDSNPTGGVPRSVFYRYGERVGSDEMKNMALLSMRKWDPGGEVQPPIGTGGCAGHVISMLREIFWTPAEGEIHPFTPELSTWLPDTEVLVARETDKPGAGFVLAAKGGHNNESHNHNDIGQFILLHGGEPVIIDTGRGEYTLRTFNPGRYDIWWTRGLGHNPPIINGVEQAASQPYSLPYAGDFRSRDVHCDESPERVKLSMDLAGAYPDEAKLVRAIRTIELQRGEQPGVLVKDEIESTEDKLDVEIRLLSPRACEVTPAGVVLSGETGSILLEVNPDNVEVLIEDAADEDKVLESWPGGLRRIILRSKTEARLHTTTLEFKEIKK